MSAVTTLMVSLATASALGPFGSPPSDGVHLDEAAESLLNRALKLTKDKGGEVGVGAGVGLACGLVTRKVQSLVVSSALLGGAALGGACYVGWLEVDQVTVYTQHARAALASRLGPLQRRLDADDDGAVTLADGKLLLSRVKPFTTRHPGFVAALVGGLVLGYQLG